jgi:hypothetical protein
VTGFVEFPTMDTDLGAVAMEIIRSGGVPALAVLVLLTGGLAIAWRRAGRELRAPPVVAPVFDGAAGIAGLRSEMDDHRDDVHSRLARLENRVDGAHLRIDAIRDRGV